MESPDLNANVYDVSQKASLGKRFVAALIDGIIAAILTLVPLVGELLGAAYILLRDGFDLEFMDRRSIGKKIMKLRPVNLDGRPMDLELSARRNWTLVLGTLGSLLSVWLGALLGLVGLIEAILVLADNKGRRFGDKFAETQVTEVAS